MIKQFLLFAGLLFSIQVMAQTGIGTSTPHASAKLHVSATDKGFLPPRVTLTAATDVTTIPSPAEGLLVYNLGSVGLQAGYYYWNGANWATIATASSPDQTVDYVSVTLSSNQTVETGSVVLFNSNIGGNIPYNTSTGMFSLIAGKTYRLTGVIAISSANTTQKEVNVVWRTAAGDLIGGRGEALSSNFSSTAFGSGIADVIYTPTVNTTISLTVNYGSGPVILWQNFTYATIQQIGSSATVNPWILSGTNTYTTIGNVGIGTSAPNPSALLDLSSSTQGVLIPRMTSSQRTAITNPVAGLVVYQTNTNPGNYVYNGSSWDILSNANYGDVKTGMQANDHNGWVWLNGRAKSLLSASQQAQATALGIGTTLPDATNAYLVQNGTLPIGTVAGSNTKTIVRANLPNVTLSGTTSVDGSHTHTIKVNSNAAIYVYGGTVTAMQEGSNNWTAGAAVSNANVINDSGNHSHPFTTSSINGGVTQTSLDITPRSLSLNTFIYLGF